MLKCMEEGYVLVRGDQCMFELRPKKPETSGDERHMKPTGFLVPAGSPLAEQLAYRCDEQHHHVATMGPRAKQAG